MPVQLPVSKRPPLRVSPKRILLYSKPKVGKTDEISKLPSCLIMDADTDQGAALYECASAEIKNMNDARQMLDKIDDYAMAMHTKEGVPKGDIRLFPYRFIGLDPIDRYELFAEWDETAKYIDSKLNSKGKFQENGYKTILDLPDGGGYYYLRNGVTNMINEAASRCTNLIITAHVREKYLGGKDEKTGESISVDDIDLAGKLGSIVCSMVDAIGYLYRREDKDHKGELWVSFQTGSKAVMGARQKYLAGQKMKFSWDVIYPDVIQRDETTGLYSLIDQTMTA